MLTFSFVNEKYLGEKYESILDVDEEEFEKLKEGESGEDDDLYEDIEEGDEDEDEEPNVEDVETEKRH